MTVSNSIRPLAAVAFLAVAVSGCSQTSDFGRSTIDPTYTYAVTQASADDQAQHFALTDEEREMNARIYRFMSMEHTTPWLRQAFLGEVGARDGVLDERAYFNWLKTEEFSSSRGRYNRLENDIRLDLVSLPTTFEAICKVQEIGRRRDVAAGNLSNIEPETQGAAAERLLENRARIEQFTASLGFRYDAYVYALEHLLVETPHEEALKVDTALSELGTANQAAFANQFCARPRQIATGAVQPGLGAI